jgi:hypothetical protein
MDGEFAGQAGVIKQEARLRAATRRHDMPLVQSAHA